MLTISYAGFQCGVSFKEYSVAITVNNDRSIPMLQNCLRPKMDDIVNEHATKNVSC